MKRSNVGSAHLPPRAAVVVDLLIPLVSVLLAHFLWDEHTIADLNDVGRRAIYQQSAGVCATLFGFTLTGLGLLMAAADKPLAGFPKGLSTSQRSRVASEGFTLLGVLAVILVGAFVFLVIDTNVKPLGIPYSLLLYLPTLAAIKLLRVVRLLKVLVTPERAVTP